MVKRQKSSKFYAVFQGRATGLFSTWADCEAQVKGYAGAKFKSFPTQAEAEAALNNFDHHQSPRWHTPPGQPKSPPKSQLVLPVTTFDPDSLAVDASCIGNPGPVEYRGVWVATGEEVFAVGPLAWGTNNLGEFLAIVTGLQYLQAQNLLNPIYSDSRTAMAWVRNRQVKTQLARRRDNQPLFEQVAQALDWLQHHHYENPIYKWETEQWGQIPADYGRK